MKKDGAIQHIVELQERQKGQLSEIKYFLETQNETTFSKEMVRSMNYRLVGFFLNLKGYLPKDCKIGIHQILHFEPSQKATIIELLSHFSQGLETRTQSILNYSNNQKKRKRKK